MVGMLFHWHIDNKLCAKEELEILLEMFLFSYSRTSDSSCLHVSNSAKSVCCHDVISGCFCLYTFKSILKLLISHFLLESFDCLFVPILLAASSLVPSLQSSFHLSAYILTQI